MTDNLFAAGAVTVAVFVIGFVAMIACFYRRVRQGQAVIRTGMGGSQVSFIGLVSIPVAHRIETIDLTVKKLTTAFSDDNSLKTRDGIEVETTAAFLVSVNREKDDILRVAGEHGAEKASALETIQKLFAARFTEALKAAVEECDFETIDAQREKFRGIVRDKIGPDLKGYKLHEIALDHFGKRDTTPD